MEKIEITAFRAIDGTVFMSEQDAVDHDFLLNIETEMTVFFASDLAPYASGPQRGMAQKVIVAWETFKSLSKDKSL